MVASTTPSPQQALGKLILDANPYAAPGDVIIDPSQILMEEDNYAAQWAFKGLTQNIKRALRIQYSYKKKDKGGEYIVTEHLIVGFAGSNGG
jgi:hypothetical protein